MSHTAGHVGLADLICLSHLRWNFVFQRPQHLITRFARERRCYYVEEPIYDASDQPWLDREHSHGVSVAVPHLPAGCSQDASLTWQRELIDELIRQEGIVQYVLWYYTPMAIAFTDHLTPVATVFDCMDELSAFANAPTALRQCEAELLRRATVVFTGGHSLYESKRDKHENVHLFPSSVDVQHFGRARSVGTDPTDQAPITKPRLGFFGVVDERMDLPMLEGIVRARPDWQVVVVGPVVKIDPATLPTAPNIHYLGPKTYDELPQYIGGWDVAILPFARNAATQFISPTKTPEYLAAGRPVVSTSIRDVVRPYGQQGLARIADTVDEFVEACEAALAEDGEERVRQADVFLRNTSWDGTWMQMRNLLEAAVSGAAAPVRAANAV